MPRVKSKKKKLKKDAEDGDAEGGVWAASPSVLALAVG